MNGTVAVPFGGLVSIKNSRTEARQSISLNILVFQPSLKWLSSTSHTLRLFFLAQTTELFLIPAIQQF